MCLVIHPAFFGKVNIFLQELVISTECADPAIDHRPTPLFIIRAEMFKGLDSDKDGKLSTEEFAAIIDEIIDQPPWRLQADTEADYVDGNQLDSSLLQKLKDLGIPPAKENVIGPA